MKNYQSYFPQISQIHVCSMREDTHDMRELMNYQMGILSSHSTATGQRVSPLHGDCGSQPTANYSLLTANSSFTFSAKERDSETGLSYFGSRYYSSDLSIWLSVDPMSDKYASLSPYVYCADNPVKLVDPNGEEVDDNLDKWKYNKTTGQLSWYSNTGGKCHQIVVETENTSSGEKISRTVEFDGAIGRLFDFSVISKTVDGIISGALGAASGTTTVLAGGTIAVGGGTVTGGATIPVGSAIFFAGAYQVGQGLIDKDIAKSIGTSILTFGVSTCWAKKVRTAVTHPKMKSIPTDAIIH